MKIAVAVCTLILASGAASAQSLPDSENGRFTFSPIADGVIRLDTRTGTVSTCADKGNGWACYAIPDERAALDTEIGRLQTANDALKAQLAQRDAAVPGKTDEALPKADLLKPKVADGSRKIEIPKIEIPLPSDRDMDRLMAVVENAWRRLIDIANRVQRDVRDKI
ncbi:hypothetical protein BH11PSE4_BH11PSE4_23350 [soil metagenome]